MSRIDHPDRSRVLAELHARPFTPINTPQRLIHFAFQVSSDEAELDSLRMARLADDGSRTPGWFEQKRHFTLAEPCLKWERHGEFVSYTFPVSPDERAEWPAQLVRPGPLLVAIDLSLVPQTDRADAMVQAVAVNGRALVLSDFAPGSRGFVDIEIVNRGMPDDVAGTTVQRLLEVETYRCFALLGLPVAEEAARVMGAIEHELPALMLRMDKASTLDDNRELLDRLTGMTLELEQSSARTHFRFAATRAYAELVRLRLEALGETNSEDEHGLTAFFSRRFEPAVRSCATAAEREANLARKLTRAAQLLRTRVEIALQSQNRDLLAAMGNRVQLQLRLQQTVEGLSVAAIAYYVASLVHILSNGVRTFSPALDPDALTAIAIVPILIGVAAAVRRVRRVHEDPDFEPPG